MRGHQDIKPPVMVKFVLGTLSLPLANLETEEHTHQNLHAVPLQPKGVLPQSHKESAVYFSVGRSTSEISLCLATDDSYVCLNMMTQELSSKFCTGDYTNSKVK